jgi:hypothetical protein
MSTGAQPVPHRVGRPHGWVVLLVVGLVAAAAVGVVVDRTVRSHPAPVARADRQRILDGLVTGPDRIAPGVTASPQVTTRSGVLHSQGIRGLIWWS